ncbi:hypothetical protein V6N13_106593 [Hibiscus sabdariffa]
MGLPQSTYAGTDAIGIWPEFDPHLEAAEQQQQQQQQPPFKRPRLSEDGQSSVVQCLPADSRVPLNPPFNKGANNIFFKTRMCAKFRLGTCRNGEGCNFAHGMEDLRQPPPNWQELVGGGRDEEQRLSGNWDNDQKIIHRMKLCKKFSNGEECPYGDRCNFLHESLSKFRDDTGRFRESSVISIGTTVPPAAHGAPYDQLATSRPGNSTGSDALRGNAKPVYPVYWKTKLCTKWEITGHCPFGEKCHFAHGQSELKSMAVHVDGDIGNGGPGLTRIGSIPTKMHNLPTNDPPKVAVNAISSDEETQAKKCLLKWKGTRKINKIYGDWLDDMPLVHTLPSQLLNLSNSISTKTTLLQSLHFSKVLLFKKGRPLVSSSLRGDGAVPSWHLGWISLADCKGLLGKQLCFVEHWALMMATDWADSCVISGHARALLEWHKLSQFCGHCGDKTVAKEAGRMKQCPQ